MMQLTNQNEVFNKINKYNINIYTSYCYTKREIFI